MASKTIDIRLGSKFDGSGISAALSGLKRLTRGATDIKTAFGMVFSSVRQVFSGIGKVLSSAFHYETQTRQFKTLIGDIDEAKRHMEDLKELGNTPPFSLDQFAAASRSLMVMTDGVLGYKKSLEMIGDAAAATGKPIEEMGHAVGRLYAFIRDGQPLSRAVTELRNMGAITPEVAQKLQDLQKAGASNIEIWAEVEKQLKRYSGAMKEVEETGEGLMGAIKSRWDNMVRSLGETFSDTAKGGLTELLDKVKELDEAGHIQKWAHSALEYLEEFKGGLVAIWGPLQKVAGTVWKLMSTPSRVLGGGIGSFVGTLSGGGGLWEAIKRGAAGAKQGFVDVWDLDGAQAAEDESYRQEVVKRKAEKKAKAEAEAAQKAAEEEKRIQDALAEGDRKRAEKAAKEEAQAKEKAEIAAAQAAAKERERLERELHQKRMDDLREEINAQKEIANGLRTTAAAAQSEFDRAFGLFRDPAQAAAARADEESYRKDLDRLHKTASRYGGKWRIDELSALMAAGDTQGVSDTLASWRKSRSFTPEVEAMVRASAAERTKTTTEDELRKIEANTADLANKLDELLTVKGGAY